MPIEKHCCLFKDELTLNRSVGTGYPDRLMVVYSVSTIQ